ncbi:MAG: hypothetical protein ACJAYC_000680 [Halieaceae bacterium]
MNQVASVEKPLYAITDYLQLFLDQPMADVLNPHQLRIGDRGGQLVVICGLLERILIPAT